MKMKFLIIVLLTGLSFQLQGQENRRVKNFNLEENLAIQGYDPVAYFTENKAIEGQESIQYIYQGIPYRFASAENLEKFKSDPSRYEPVYGGWCAYAMGDTGDKVKIDPETFKIIDGQLYLFYNFFFNNTLKDWNRDQSNLRLKADKNWAKIIE